MSLNQMFPCFPFTKIEFVFKQKYVYPQYNIISNFFLSFFRFYFYLFLFFIYIFLTLILLVCVKKKSNFNKLCWFLLITVFDLFVLISLPSDTEKTCCQYCKSLTYNCEMAIAMVPVYQLPLFLLGFLLPICTDQVLVIYRILIASSY